MVAFEERGNRTTRRKPLGAEKRREPTNSSHVTPDLGIEPGPYWWEASALTTAPSLHPTNRDIVNPEHILWRNDRHTCRTMSMILSYVHLKNFRYLQRDSNPWPFISQPHVIKFLSLSIPFTGTREPNKLTYSHLSGSMTQMLRALHRHRTGHGIESLGRELKFYRCTYEIVGASSLQFISQPHFLNVSFTEHIWGKYCLWRFVLQWFNIIEIHIYVVFYDCSLLCYEFPESTPLDEYLKNKKIVLNLDTLLVVAVDLIDAIQCLENTGVVHNNITTSTVLIAKGFRVSNKSLDFFLFYGYFSIEEE